jgi:hypothetical protein
MFSEMDLVARSVEDMGREVAELLVESKRLHEGHIAADQKEKELRLRSVEIRPINAEEAEAIWQEAERLKDEGREMLRLSLEKKLRAAEVQHRIEINDQIESITNYDEVWRNAVKSGKA